MKYNIMEITLSIPQNKWARPVEVRTEVVQAICNAFLKNAIWHPYAIDAYVNVKTNKLCGFEHAKEDGCVKFHECEMRTAFQALVKAGYWFIRHDAMNGLWYELSIRDNVPAHMTHRRIVTDFIEQWD